MLRATTYITALIALGAAVASAQATARDQGAPTFRASSSLVLLDVFVKDSKGRNVPNLRKDSLRIYEDGAEQEIASFSYEQRPVSWGLVLDRSGSMFGMMQEVYNAALHSVEAGTPEDETFILAFDDRIEMVRPFTADHASLVKAIKEISAGGTTALYDAVFRGLEELKQGRHQKKVLIVVTDGEDNASRTRFEELLKRAKQSETQIYTIGMFSDMTLDLPEGFGGQVKRQLEVLAENTGGLAYFPKNVRQCDRACKTSRSG